ncbi:DUF6233 domain-containing protein [Streptomyces sp. NPDC002730]|uniref:DUF6233 domain-containing protein n=1 Tax=Streptomyces sp. NPDC002730 TaxID=3364662 RepID=UPI003688371C
MWCTPERPPLPPGLVHWCLCRLLGAARAHGGHGGAVHTSDCRMTGKPAKQLTREQALRTLTEGGITACPYCRPDTDLGVL